MKKTNEKSLKKKEWIQSCVMPEMPYCPACKYGREVWPEWVESREDMQDCCCDWVCSAPKIIVETE